MITTILLGIFAFAILHSLTADRRIKHWFRQQFGERAYHGLYRLIYNIVSVLTIVPILAAVWLYGRTLYTVPPILHGVFLILQIIGLLGLTASLLQIDLGQFLGTTQLMAYLRGEPLPLPTEPLKTDGLYGLVRHPLYFFSLLVIWPFQPMTDLLLAFNIGVTLYFLIGSRMEEQRMLEYYGDEYAAYRKQVPWMLPLPNRKKIEA